MVEGSRHRYARGGMGTVWVLANPAADSGRGLAAAQEVVDELRRREVEVELLTPASVDAIGSAIGEAAAAGMDRLLLVGGDGLVHRCLPALVDTDIVVGIVAGGSGNDFATGLGLPADRSEAVAAATDVADAVRPVDLIRAEVLSVGGGTPQPTSGWAATVVTGGFSGRVNRRADRLRFPRGPSRYTVATLLELSRLRATEVTLTIDDAEPRTIEASLFAVANTAYFGGGMAICPEASPFDGTLDVTVVGRASAVTLARLLPTVFSGRHVDHRSVTTYRGRQIRLDTTEALWADGEPFMEVPGWDEGVAWSVLLSAAPAAIEVSAPRPSVG